MGGLAHPSNIGVLRVGPFEPVGYGWGSRVGVTEIALLDSNNMNMSLLDIRVSPDSHSPVTRLIDGNQETEWRSSTIHQGKHRPSIYLFFNLTDDQLPHAVTIDWKPNTNRQPTFVSVGLITGLRSSAAECRLPEGYSPETTTCAALDALANASWEVRIPTPPPPASPPMPPMAPLPPAPPLPPFLPPPSAPPSPFPPLSECGYRVQSGRYGHSPFLIHNHSEPLSGVPTMRSSSRGFMFGLVDPSTFELVEYRSFDTWRSDYGMRTLTPGSEGGATQVTCPLDGAPANTDGRYACSYAMAAWLTSLESTHPGYIMLVATYDEASNSLGSTGYAALRNILGSSLTQLASHRMYALISTIGADRPMAEHIVSGSEPRDTVAFADYSYVACLPPSPPQAPPPPGLPLGDYTSGWGVAIQSIGSGWYLQCSGDGAGPALGNRELWEIRELPDYPGFVSLRSITQNRYLASALEEARRAARLECNHGAN